MHPEQHTELDSLVTMQHNLRTSTKGSNDAYDVSASLTSLPSIPALHALLVFVRLLLCVGRGLILAVFALALVLGLTFASSHPVVMLYQQSRFW